MADKPTVYTAMIKAYDDYNTLDHWTAVPSWTKLRQACRVRGAAAAVIAPLLAANSAHAAIVAFRLTGGWQLRREIHRRHKASWGLSGGRRLQPDPSGEFWLGCHEKSWSQTSNTRCRAVRFRTGGVCSAGLSIFLSPLRAETPDDEDTAPRKWSATER